MLNIANKICLTTFFKGEQAQHATQFLAPLPPRVSRLILQVLLQPNLHLASVSHLITIIL